MKNVEFLEIYQHLQYQIMYNYLIDLGFASIAIGNTYDSPFFNHAQINKIISSEELKKIESVLEQYSRKPALYFENNEGAKDIIKFAEGKGYSYLWEDSWMFHDGNGTENLDFSAIKKVKTVDALEEFLNTFDSCYVADDPQNPYGKLGNYIDITRTSWERHNKSGKIEYFTVFDESSPVAVSTLTNFTGIGYISNVGSLPSVRGKGFGKIASLYCVAQSIKNGNKVHTLATEENQYPNDFYKHIGFKTKFNAIGYVKIKK